MTGLQPLSLLLDSVISVVSVYTPQCGEDDNIKGELHSSITI